MSGINLLPQKTKPTGYAVNASKPLKKISKLLVIALLLVITVAVSVNLFLSLQQRLVISKEADYKKQIKALEETEQKLVLISDRLSGIQKLRTKESTVNQLNTFQRVIDKNPSEVTMKGAKLSPEKAVVRIGATESKQLTSFYLLLQSMDFAQISLDGLSYDNVDGYQVDVAIN